MSEAIQTYELFVRATPEAVWSAITDPAQTSRYFFGTSVASTFRPGDPIVYTMGEATLVDGVVVEAEAPRRLVHTWTARYDAALATEQSKVTWLIEKRGEACKLTATHDLTHAPNTARNVASEGWSLVLSGLKTLLETGTPLVVAQPGA